MSSRTATPRIPSVSGAPKGSDLSGFLGFLSSLRILRGTFVTFQFTAATAVLSRHGLGRRYLGGFIASQTAQYTQSLSVVDPETMRLSGYDPTTHVMLQVGSAGGVTYTGTVVAWCF